MSITTKLDTRQSRNNSYLGMIANRADFDAKAYNNLDKLLGAINDELTPVFRLFGNDPADRILNIGSQSVTNSETSVRHSNNFIDKAYPTFTSGTVTLPAASGGTIVVSPTTDPAPILTLAPGQFIKILIELDRTGNLSVKQGVSGASEAAATMPSPTAQKLQLGVLVALNTAGVIQNVIGSRIIQFSNQGNTTSANEGVTTTVTAAGTTILTSSSTSFQQFTGTSTQTVKLPDATTMANGMYFLISNRSTQILTVTLNDNSTLTTVAPTSQKMIRLISNATSNGTWDTNPSFLVEQQTIDTTTSGTNINLPTPTVSFIKYTNVGFISVSSIGVGIGGQILEVTNGTGAPITFNNEDLSAPAAQRIVTGTGANLTLSNGGSARFVYDSDGINSRWRVVGGSGGSTETGRSIPFSMLGSYNLYGAQTDVLLFRLTQNITITEFRTFIGNAGTSGTTTVDIQLKRGAGAFASLLTTLPSIPFGAGDFSDSATGAGATAAVIGGTTNLLADDILRIDLTAVQGGTIARDLIALLYYTI